MKENEVTLRTFDRAEKLEGVLHRVAGTEHALNQIGQGKALYLNWMSEGHEVSSVILNQTFLKGMKRIAVTLFHDLATEGETVLAKDIVEQHLEERTELLGTPAHPRRLTPTRVKP